MHPISMKNMSNYIIRLAVYYVYTTDTVDLFFSNVSLYILHSIAR